jgi:hypothetical protein
LKRPTGSSGATNETSEASGGCPSASTTAWKKFLEFKQFRKYGPGYKRGKKEYVMDDVKSNAQASQNIDDLLDEVIEVDANVTAEEYFKPALPDDGPHTATLSLSDRGITISRQKDKAGDPTGPAYLIVHVQAQVLDENGNVAGIVFENVTSIIMPSMRTSRVHAMLDAVGFPAPKRCTLGELKAHVEAALEQKPRCTVVTRWEAQEMIGDKYVTVRKGQKHFPPVLDPDGKPSGKFSPEVEGKTGLVRAQARVVRYERLKGDQGGG